MIGKPNDLFIHHRSHLSERFTNGFYFDRREIFKISPGIIVNLTEIIKKFLPVPFVEMPERIPRLFHYPVCNFEEPVWQGNGSIQIVCQLIIEFLKTI